MKFYNDIINGRYVGDAMTMIFIVRIQMTQEMAMTIIPYH